MRDPYDGIPSHDWTATTEALISSHPLDQDEVVDVVLGCWSAILDTRIGGKAKIGVHVFPRPQIMGTFLHELIPLEFNDRYPAIWRREERPDEKDLVYVPDPGKSVEIKTSSHKSQIFGNRSFAQRSPHTKKGKSGYYLTVNFEKFTPSRGRPKIVAIHFGWLSSTDWIAQRAPTGQQARLPRLIYGTKLLPIFKLPT